MKETLEAATIRQYAKQLRLPTIASQFGKLAEQAIQQQRSHLSYLDALLEAEVEERERRVSRSSKRWRSFILRRLRTCRRHGFATWPRGDI